MTTLTRCDVCGFEAPVGERVAGWASLTFFAPKVGMGRRGESEHLDLCPVCAEELRGWVAERRERRSRG